MNKNLKESHAKLARKYSVKNDMWMRIISFCMGVVFSTIVGALYFLISSQTIKGSVVAVIGAVVLFLIYLWFYPAMRKNHKQAIHHMTKLNLQQKDE